MQFWTGSRGSLVIEGGRGRRVSSKSPRTGGHLRAGFSILPFGSVVLNL